MKCGLFEMDITPPLGKNLPGYFVMRPASGVKDRLMAKAIALTGDNGHDFLLVSIDAVSADKETTDIVRARAHELTGVPEDHIMVAATHAHTGGPVDNFVEGTRDDAYVRWMSEKAADALALAYNNRVEARIGFGRGEEHTIAFIRRYKMADGTFATNPGFGKEILGPAGEIDPSVEIMKIEDASGKLLCVVTNFACHLDTVGGNAYCADYPGELSRVIKKVYGESVVSLFLTGACGNINHFDFQHRQSRDYYDKANPPHYVRMGRILAGDVVRALATIETKAEADVSVATGSFEAAIRRPTQADIDRCEAYLKDHPYKVIVSPNNGTSEGGPALGEIHFAHALLDVAKMTKTVLTVPTQAARIGEAVLCGMPCELFVEFGLDLKARAGAEHVFVSTLTDGHFGYLATRDSFAQGGYEVQISGDTMMEPETGYRLVDGTLDLIGKI